MADLSEMEHVVLGIIWKKGPCTPYLVRKEFITSPSPHFSGSEGAIYPLVRRLEKRGLLTSKADRTGQRPRRLFRITQTGSTALRRWLRPPLADDVAAPGHDPIRTRLYFLAALSAAKRSVFLDDSEHRLRNQIPILQAHIRDYIRIDDVFAECAARGMLHATRARIAWITEVRRRLNEANLADCSMGRPR